MSITIQFGIFANRGLRVFIRNCWYVAGWGHEFEPRQLHDRLILNEPVVIYRKQNGALVALENRCVHRFAALSLGCLEGDDLRCMYHGFKFAPSGLCVEIPGQESVPSAARVRRYPIVERHSWAWIWMGDPELADEGLIPPAKGLDDPNWVLRSGFLDYNATYKLINDNLTDLSHLSFTHKDSFKAGPHWVLARPTVMALERGVRVQRWVTDPPPPYLRDCHSATIDKLSEYDYLVPGIFLLHTAIFPNGTADTVKSGGAAPSPLWETFSCQAVTPSTERTTRYFFSWGPGCRHGSAAAADTMFQIALQAFAEDKVVIEAQQRIIDLDPSRQILATRADMAAITFERLMNRLMAEEATAVRGPN
jgi:phenylpropionate dioxygenase-like ring-hydroxylating dioxygenase large terminal subunit